MSPSNDWENVPITSSIKTTVLKIMQSVYRHRNLIVPLQFDKWRNWPYFTYKVEGDSSTPSTIILEFNEGEPDQPVQRMHFMIFVDQQIVYDGFRNEDFASPDDIAYELLELQNFALRHARRRQQSILRVQQQLTQNEQAAKQRKEEAIQSLYKRLLEHRAVEQHALPSPPEYICPVCKAPEALVKCLKWGILCCPDPSCPSHSSDGLKVCTEHQDTRFCRSCIDAGDNAKLRPCPVKTCDKWTCEKDWKWCFGRPVHILPSFSDDTSDTNPSSSRKGKQKATAPAHPPALAPCPNHHEFVWTKCSARGCWSKKVPKTLLGSYRPAICPACEAQPGHKTCSNQCTWICAVCAFKRVRPIWNCPSCRTALCNDCGMAKRCIGCRKSEWCSTCRGQSNEGNGAQPIGEPTGINDTGCRERGETKFDWTCSICESALCNTCSRNSKLELSIVCEYCSEACCRSCMSIDECSFFRKEVIRCSDCADRRESSLCCDAPCKY
ncbi:hypothetical protein DFS33DRAFT_1336035 [Desarmillaria ectypa]|nr:hypothetical protein DFS33DRAFT_1336035 [Desarmillaria ectypa]